MSSNVRERLLVALKKIDRPGTFCFSGRLPPILPGLEVAGAGSIALPLEKRQAAALKKRAHQAPYGKGTQTIVDTDVRRVWEIDADQIELTNPDWAGAVKQAIATAQSELGLEKQRLDAQLYKLLLYEPGSFFLPHRDGEKLDRMVATLVIALPAVHEGGQLVVRHEGREAVVDFAPESRFQTQFAAFYADCEHEIRPVTKGFRLALIYNLTLQRSKQPIVAPRIREHIAEIADILGHWKVNEAAQPPAEADETGIPTKLAVVLDHKYSAAGLSFDALKGIDRAKADVLFAAAAQSGLDASLALVNYWESGSAEPSDDYGYHHRRRYDDDDEADDDEEEEDDDGGSDHVMGEVYDYGLTAEQFSDLDGKRLAFGEIHLGEAELVAEAPLSDGKPDKEEFEGYTGNAGMTLDRWYHRAAVMLWPAEARFDVLCEAGMDAAVGGLEQAVGRWKAAKKADQPALKQHCLEFAARLIANWPERSRAGGYSANEFASAADDEVDEVESDDEPADDFDDDDDKPSEDDDLDEGDFRGGPPEPDLLALLATLGDADLISAWIRGVLAKDAAIRPGEELGDVCRQFGWRTFGDELFQLFEGTTNETIERHARLLADWATREEGGAERKRLCTDLARSLMSFVEGWNPRPPKHDWEARRVDCSKLLPPLVQSFTALDEPKLLERLTAYILERPGEFDLTTVRIPALLGLAPG